MTRRALESLGQLVREKRGKRKLRETAAEIGISAPTLMRVEAGRTPDVETFGKLCVWIGVDPSEFLGEVGAAGKAGSQVDALDVSVHLKAPKLPNQETIRALSQMILLAAQTQPGAG